MIQIHSTPNRAAADGVVSPRRSSIGSIRSSKLPLSPLPSSPSKAASRLLKMMQLPFNSSGKCDAHAPLEDDLKKPQKQSAKQKQQRKQQHRGKRRVRFDVDRKDNVKVEVRTYEKAVDEKEYAEDEDILQFSSNRLEIRNRKLELKHYLQRFVPRNAQVVESIWTLFDCPLTPPYDVEKSNLTEQEAIEILGRSAARGLELRMPAPMLLYQKWSRAEIVAKSRSLLLEEGLTPGTAEFDDAVRERCVEINECTRVFALRLAEADRIEAQKVYEEMGLGTSTGASSQQHNDSISSLSQRGEQGIAI